MKKPRLTDADRLAIETGLRSGKTVYCIAKELSRPVTIGGSPFFSSLAKRCGGLRGFEPILVYFAAELGKS